MKRRIPLSEFFFLVEARELDRLFTADYIEEATNHNPKKLKVLLEELQIHLGMRREEVEHSLKDRIAAKMKEYLDQGLTLPTKVIEFPAKFKQEPTLFLDKDKLLGGEITWQLYPLYELRNDIKTKLKEALKVIPTQEPEKVSPNIINQPADERSEIGLEQYLNEEGQKYLPVLLELYKNHKPPGDQARMLFALHDLGLLSTKPIDISPTDYHNALKASFGDGIAITRSAVLYQFKQAETTLGQTKIKKHVVRIKSAIKSLEKPA